MAGSAGLLRGKGNGITLIFDADDTLWENEAPYNEAYPKFGSLMASLGFDGDYAVKKMKEINLALTKTMGLSGTRFGTAFADAYKLVCAEKGTAPDSKILDSVFELGCEAVNRQRTFYPGVEDALINLRKEGYELVLLTAGDATVQQKKIESLNLGRFFDEMRVVALKNTKVYSELMKELSLDPERTFMVGNSLKSDMIPALEAGLRAIYVPRYTWAYEVHDEAELQKFKGRYSIGNDATEVSAILKAGHGLEKQEKSKSAA